MNDVIMRGSWFDHDMWIMIIAMIWKGYEVIWREWKRILYYIQCWAVICYATFHTLCQYDMVQYTMIWFIWYIMRWTIDWYEHSNCKYSIFILSLYTWMYYKYSQVQIVFTWSYSKNTEYVYRHRSPVSFAQANAGGQIPTAGTWHQQKLP